MAARFQTRQNGGGFAPEVMTPALAKQLESEGYALPKSWPASARVTTAISSRTGWQVRTTTDMVSGRNRTEYTAPDGTRLVKVHNGKKPVLVAVTTRGAPTVLVLATGSRRPPWMSKEKGPMHPNLVPLRKGERLVKGQKRVTTQHHNTPLIRVVNPKLTEVERQIAEQTKNGGRASPGLLAYRTRLLGGGGAQPKSVKSKPTPVIPLGAPLELALSFWEHSRRALDAAEKAGTTRSIPALRAVLTRRVQLLSTEWALQNPTGDRDGFIAWVAGKVGEGIVVLPEVRRSLPRRLGQPKERGPTTRYGILAAGLVKIIKTPKQLDREKGWWHKGSPWPDTARAYREGMSPGLPHWLKPVPIPREVAHRQIALAEARQRAEVQYIGNRHPTPYRSMTPDQIKAELGRQLRRLGGGETMDPGTSRFELVDGRYQQVVVRKPKPLATFQLLPEVA